MHRFSFILAILMSLSFSVGCTVHHSASASASVRAGGEASGGARESADASPVRHRAQPSPRTVPDRGDRRPPRLVVDRRRPAPSRPAPSRPAPGAPEAEPEVTEPEADPEEEEPIFGSPIASDGKFEGNVYFLPANTRKLPDFEALEPVGTVYAKKLDIAPRSFDEGFPGISERFEWFAIRYTAQVAIEEGGEYSFRIHSDDGTKLYIDGELVVDNDGQHAPRSKSGKVTLDPGVHEFVIEYFQGPRYQIALQLFVTPPGGEEGIFSLE